MLTDDHPGYCHGTGDDKLAAVIQTLEIYNATLVQHPATEAGPSLKTDLMSIT
jgi:hypothetical protein